MKENWKKLFKLKLKRRLRRRPPKRSPILNKTPNQQKMQEDSIVLCLGSKAPPLMKPKVIKATASRKLVLQKNTRLAA